MAGGEFLVSTKCCVFEKDVFTNSPLSALGNTLNFACGVCVRRGLALVPQNQAGASILYPLDYS